MFSIGNLFCTSCRACCVPEGPGSTPWVGRQDNSTPAPDGIIPDSSDSVESILTTFEAIGLSANDVIALIGAQSTAIRFSDDLSQAGTAFDSSPDVWDANFYGQTLAGAP
jgi:manganese peroxidase